jgi:plastocyanin
MLWVALLSAAVATLLLVACSGTSATPAQSNPTARAQSSPTPVAIVHVKIIAKNGQYAFNPGTLTIKAGTQVIWTNDSPAPHTVTSATGVFNTPDMLAQHQVFKVIFTKPGTYMYYCNIHLYMQGTIIVTS